MLSLCRYLVNLDTISRPLLSPRRPATILTVINVYILLKLVRLGVVEAFDVWLFWLAVAVVGAAVAVVVLLFEPLFPVVGPLGCVAAV